VRLLNRTTRSVAPTEAGEQLLAQLVPALTAVSGALDAVRHQGRAPSGRLRINGPPPAIHLVLAPMIAAFLARYPAVTVDVVADSALVDIVGDGFDAGVRYGEDLAQDMIAVPLGVPERYVLVAAPALIAGCGAPGVPADLLTRPCLAVRFAGRSVQNWVFERGGETVSVVPSGPLTSNDPALLLRAALEGAGFLLSFEGYVREALAAGRLVAVLDDWFPYFPGPFLYYPSRRQPPSALAAFVAFVAAWRAGLVGRG
jgi:DNA-binding transcriptional LysR family regulator